MSEMRPAGEQPRELHLTANGHDLCVFEWAGEGAPILLAHATGFHARIWDEVVRRLPGRRVIAVDLRGHGRSAKPSPPYVWDDLGVDIVDLLRALDLHDVVMAGHSMGGYIAVSAAAREPSRSAGLLLLDPTITPPREGPPPAAAPDNGIARRRNEWASPDEMVERFRDRFPFQLWQPQVLEDYARYGLLPAPSGEGYVLACPPAIEAVIYGGASQGGDIWAAVRKVELPVRILRARGPQPGVPERPFETSPTSPALASTFRHGEERVLADLTHFFPMQAPELVAEEIAVFASRVAPA